MAETVDYVLTTGPVTSEIVIDNTDPGWTNTSQPGNNWTVGSSSAVPKIGSNYLYYAGDGSLTESGVTRKCRWTPDLSAAGLYDVYVFYQKGTNRNTAAPYTIHYDGGQLTSVQNQYSSTPNQGGWFLIGENLPFQAGSTGYVELTTLSLDTKYVSADAAKWVLKSLADTSPPIMTAVVDEQYTTSTTALQGSWSGSDPESGIQRYEYAVGSAPGLTDVKTWTSAGASTSMSITPLSLAVGETYYISARAVNGANLTSTPMSSGGVTVVHAAGSIAEAKEMQDGEPVGLPALPITAKFTGKFYIQDESRASGIRVEASTTAAVNQAVQVYGVLGLVGGERALTNCLVLPGSMGPAIAPVAMLTRAAGGAAFGDFTPGVTG